MEKKFLAERVVTFSKSVLGVCSELEKIRQLSISNQLLRSATAIGASVYEAQYAESLDDFIHKMKLACKEANETYYWFRICENLIHVDFGTKQDLEIIQKILNKSIATAIKRRGSK